MKPHTVRLPPYMSGNNVYPFLAEIVDAARNPVHQAVIFDFGSLQFIAPIGVTVLSNALELLLNNGVVCTFINHQKPELEAIRYLDDSQFFRRYLKADIRSDAAIRPTTVPLQCIERREGHFWLEQSFLTWLSRQVSQPVAILGAMKVCLQELFNNIAEHSEEQIGCIYMQHYPNIKKIVIALSDFGVGIPRTISQIMPALTDGQALAYACQRGVSTKSTPGNQGLGLDILVNTVVQRNEGQVFLCSGNGRLTCSLIHGREVRHHVEVQHFYPGTLFEIVLRTDTTGWLDAEEDMEW